jgi:hypothetical protein
MVDLQHDPVFNCIHEGIKGDIDFAVAHKRWRAAVILIYAGMDAMTFLDLPAGQERVAGSDFIKWATRCIRFPCKEQVSGADLYGARCAMLHIYSSKSKMSTEQKCRMTAYMEQSIPEVRYDANIDPTLVLVSVPALKDAFFKGIDAFLVDAFADKAKRPILVERLGWFTVQLAPLPMSG